LELGDVIVVCRGREERMGWGVISDFLAEVRVRENGLIACNESNYNWVES
jgi:hypothetical protein